MFRLAIVLALTAAACKGGARARPAPSTAPDAALATPPPAPPPPPRLTVERLLSTRGLLDGALRPWDQALATATDHLGPPTRVDGPRAQWAAIDGARCAYAVIERQDGTPSGVRGDVAAVITPPTAVEADGPALARRDCLRLAGATPGPPEDPQAPAPPADGTPVTVDAFRTGAVVARSRWAGRSVRVVGRLTGTAAAAGDARALTATLAAGPDDAARPVSCALVGPPPRLAAGSEVVASGTVRIAEWVTVGSGDIAVEAVLDACTLTAAAPR